MRLPPELQILVCQNMTKTELKNARLICKSLNQAAVPMLFDEVFIAATYSDLEIADLVASRFGSYIKTITLSFVQYPDYSKDRFIELGSKAREKITLERVDGHLAYAFKNYRKVRKEHLEVTESCEFLTQLCQVLRRLIRCRKIVITDRGNGCSGHKWAVHRHDPWKKEDLCPYQNCPLSESDHVSFFIRPDPPFSEDQAQEWYTAILALSIAAPRFTELVVGGEGHNGFLPMSAFNMMARQSSHVVTCFKILTKLKLSLSPDHDTRDIVAKALSAAINLECLFIEGDGEILYDVPGPMSMVSAILGGCRFAKLRSLILANMTSNENELLEFLRNSPLLEHLTIYQFLLERGFWHEVAVSIRATLRLKTVMFDALYGGFAEIDQGNDYSHKYLLVEDFFLRNGNNPFTEEEKYRSWGEGLNSSFVVNNDMTCEKRYEIFH
ncbi:MAG: hypothetical protein ASARMPRED_004667 [Alectoria sarmentosa]|nr:MAG: hypothetical protein ASARMPRED_004667 [Alectoria sarmentosa]